jgi:simple sugar transport system permease protein/ribose transport system permease protein
MRPATLRFIRRHPETGTIALVVMISCLFVVMTHGLWLSVGNLQSVLRLTAVLAIMSFGEAIVIATGEIDISVGSTFGIGALTFLGLAPIIGSGLASVAALLGGMVIGALNGAFGPLIGLPSLIVTLGTLFLFQGIAFAMTYGFSFAATDVVRQQLIYKALGGGLIAGLNPAVVWVVATLVGAQLLIFETSLGNRILAVGGDATSSYSRGVNVRKLKFGVFVLSGLLAAFAGVLEAAYIGYADGSFGALMELSAIAAAVLGGCHLTGGRISLVGTLLGAFLLCGIQSFLILLGFQPQWYILTLGAIVVFASLLDRTVSRLIVKKG